MTHTVFPTFQTQYILDFSLTSRNTGSCQTLRFSSLPESRLPTQAEKNPLKYPDFSIKTPKTPGDVVAQLGGCGGSVRGMWWLS
jgi:hypothetical protein